MCTAQYDWQMPQMSCQQLRLKYYRIYQLMRQIIYSKLSKFASNQINGNVGDMTLESKKGVCPLRVCRIMSIK